MVCCGLEKSVSSNFEFSSGFLQGMQIQRVQFSEEKGFACVSRLNSSFLQYFNFKVKIQVEKKLKKD